MKQTNNAITMLKKAYLSIFKTAYLSGKAPAFVFATALTAVLATTAVADEIDDSLSNSATPAEESVVSSGNPSKQEEDLSLQASGEQDSSATAPTTAEETSTAPTTAEATSTAEDTSTAPTTQDSEEVVKEETQDQDTIGQPEETQDQETTDQPEDTDGQDSAAKEEDGEKQDPSEAEDNDAPKQEGDLAEAEDPVEEESPVVAAKSFAQAVVNAAENAKAYVVSGTESYVSGNGGFIGAVTIESTGALSIADAKADIRTKDITLESGATLTIANTTSTKGLVGTHTDSDGSYEFSEGSTFKATGAIVDLTKSSLKYNRFVFDSTQVDLSGSMGSYWNDNTVIMAKAHTFSNGDGVISIKNGSTINLNENSLLQGVNVNAINSTINFGSSSDSKSAVIVAHTDNSQNGGEINLSNTVLNIKGKGAYIAAPVINMTGVSSSLNISNGAELTLAGSLDESKELSGAVGYSSSSIAKFSNGTFNNDGTLNIFTNVAIEEGVKSANNGKIVIGNNAAADAGPVSGSLTLGVKAGKFNFNLVQSIEDYYNAGENLQGIYQINKNGTLNFTNGTYYVSANQFVDAEGIAGKNNGAITVANSRLIFNSMDDVRKLGNIELKGASDESKIGELLVNGTAELKQSDFATTALHGTSGQAESSSFSARNVILNLNDSTFNSQNIEVVGDESLFINAKGSSTVSLAAGTTLGTLGNFTISAGSGAGTLNIADSGYVWIENDARDNVYVRGNFILAGGGLSFEQGMIDAGSSDIKFKLGDASASQSPKLKVRYEDKAVVADPLSSVYVKLNSISRVAGDTVENNKSGIIEVQQGTLEVNNYNLDANVKAYIAQDSSAQSYGPAKMIVNGLYKTGDSGVSLAKGGILELGSNVVSGITFNGNTISSYGANLDAKQGIVNNGGTLKLDFNSGEFNITQINNLLNYFYKDASGLKKNQGFIDLSNAAIAGVDEKINANGEITASDLNSALGGLPILAATNNNLSKATVTDVNANTLLNGSFGAIKLANNVSTFSMNSANVQLNGNANGQFVATATGENAEIRGNDSTFALNGNGTIGDITLTGNSNLNMSGEVNSGALHVSQGAISIAGKVTSDNISANTLTISAGELNSTKDDGSATIVTNALTMYGGALTADTIHINGGTTASNTISGGNITAKAIDARNTTIQLNGGAEVKSDLYDITGSTLYVGAEGVDSSSATLDVETLVANSGAIIVDPEFGEETAILSVRNFTSSKLSASPDNVIATDLIVGRNSAIGLGLTDTQVKSAIAQYQTNGSLKSNEIGAIALINKTGTKVADGRRINVGTDDVSALKVKGAANSIYLGSGGALQFTANGLSDKEASIQFLGANSSIYGDGGQIIMPAGATHEQLAKALTDNTGAALVLAQGGKVVVSSDNGLYKGELTSGQSLSDIEFTVQPDDRKILSGMSDPVYKYTVSVLEENGQEITTKTAADDLYGFYFLQDGASTGNGSAVEKVARAAANAGAFQTANLVVMNTAEALNARAGLGLNNNVTAVSSNGVAGLWLSPIYHGFSSSGFSAQGVNTGAKVDLYGAALGFDYKLNDMAYVGAMLQVGNADSKGKGAGSGVKNDINYFGGSLYANFKPMDNLAIVADVSYNKFDNDVSIDSGITDYKNITSDFKLKTLSVGATAGYTLALEQDFKVTPHAGLRYTNYKFDNLDIYHDGHLIAVNDVKNMNVFSIPVGVKLGRDFVQNEWTVSPAADLTLTANFGDRKLKNSFAVVENYSTDLQTNVIDSVCYGVKVGVAATNGNLSFGANVGYQGSSNTNDLGINANIGYRF